MTDTAIDTRPALEAAALNAALEARAHFRRCRTCRLGMDPCPVGAPLIDAVNGALYALGDHFVARGRVVARLQA